MTRATKLVVVIVAGFAPLVSTTGAAQQSAAGSGVEDIYVARSLRLSRVAPSDYCAARRTGFLGSTFEDRYDVKAVASRPEPGITPWRCYLDLTGLPAGFTGGQLTTNTIISRTALGAVSDPVGYTQPSIATVRLWRKR